MTIPLLTVGLLVLIGISAILMLRRAEARHDRGQRFDSGDWDDKDLTRR